MHTSNIHISNSGLVELTQKQQKEINGGGFWGAALKVGCRLLVGAAAVGTGAAVAIGVGLLAYEIYCAVTD